MINLVASLLFKFANIIYWIHSKFINIASSIDPLVKIGISENQKKIINNNKQLYRKHENVRRCFILACGPSINKLDIKKLKDEFCISVSNFFVHPDFNIVKPRYHVFAPRDARMSAEHFADWFREFEKHASGSEVLVSISDIDSVVKYNGLTKSNIYYYASLFSSPKELYYNFDFSKPIPLIHTVTHLALYLAINIGIKEIYLLGFDHDMILNIGKSRHFYPETENALTRAGYEEWVNDIDMELLGGHYKYMWKVYKEIKEFVSDKNIKIINLTPGSLLDDFPRGSFAEI